MQLQLHNERFSPRCMRNLRHHLAPVLSQQRDRTALHSRLERSPGLHSTDLLLACCDTTRRIWLKQHRHATGGFVACSRYRAKQRNHPDAKRWSAAEEHYSEVRPLSRYTPPVHTCRRNACNNPMLLAVLAAPCERVHAPCRGTGRSTCVAPERSNACPLAGCQNNELVPLLNGAPNFRRVEGMPGALSEQLAAHLADDDN